MIKIYAQGGRYRDGRIEPALAGSVSAVEDTELDRRKSLTWKILSAHDESRGAAAEAGRLKIRFDALASHDITYVGIVQTARASGMKSFPLPYVLTNCHNSLCAVGGTINEDDHAFGLSAARKYGGDFVPAHLAVIHQYVREVMAGGGKMILGSDSHTRYGALGTMGVGEGGPELVKQLLGRHYELERPQVAGVYLHGAPKTGVGPQDVALSIIGAVFEKGVVKNKVMEFIGPGIAGLSTEYRLGVDVMTTETTCLSSIWETDSRVEKYLELHGRKGDFRPLAPENGVFYDTLISVDLGKIEPMIALPFHPGNVHTVRDFLANADDLLAAVEKETREYVSNRNYRPDLRRKFRNGRFYTDQAVIAGCAGGSFENIALAARLLGRKKAGGPGYGLSVYPASQPLFLELTRQGYSASLMESGAVLRTAFCGPCFGAGDVPQNNAFSIRHATRNFPNREGSRPADGQMAFVALMDARSIAATALHGGALTPATDLEDFPAEGSGVFSLEDKYNFDREVYAGRVYHGRGKAGPELDLAFGPNIADWPAMPAMPENLILEVVTAIYDPVTTTDELIPSGETSSYRSNPLKLSEFTLSRKDPAYVGKAKAVQALALELQPAAAGLAPVGPAAAGLLETARRFGLSAPDGEAGLAASFGLGSAVFARRPGDGSAREQAASCQKVLGGWANLAAEYATRRYRSNLINWGLLPLLCKDWETLRFQTGDFVFLPNIRQAVSLGLSEMPAGLQRGGKTERIILQMAPLSQEERQILLDGCLINYYAAQASR